MRLIQTRCQSPRSRSAHRTLSCVTATCLIAALGGLSSPSASASERRFTHTYQSLVLGPGQLELEPSTTFRGGREGLYLRMDERLEFEIGLFENVQTAWYLNGSARTEAVGDALKRELEFGGVSNEWKWKLLDPVADVMGLALYGEWTAAPSEAELEAKIIVDKNFGDLIVALNLVGEVEWELEGVDEVNTELALELDAGLAYLITPSLGVGLELVNTSGFSDERLEHSVVMAGPSLSYAQEGWWMALSVLPQIVDLAALGTSELQDLDDHERVRARLLFGIHL